jgi:hypothetical protein
LKESWEMGIKEDIKKAEEEIEKGAKKTGKAVEKAGKEIVGDTGPDSKPLPKD